MNTHRATLTALTVVGAVMALNSLVLGTRTFFSSAPFSEIAGTASHVGYQATLLASMLALNLLLPRLSGLVGGTGRVLPEALLGLAAVATFLDGGTRFVEAFVTPYLADHAPALLDDAPASMLMNAMIGAWVLWTVTLASLGVVAFRRRVFARPACVLLVIGGLSIPAVGPLSGAVVGAGLAWAAGSRLRDRVPAAPDASLVSA